MVSNMKSSVMIVTLILTGIFLFMKDKHEQDRNVRNNNPLNIREDDLVDYDWVGEHERDLDSEFEEFESVEYGFRAAYKVLLTYRNKRKLDTIAGIIGRWAPPSENDTQGYIDYVAKRLNFSPYETLSLERYPELINAMADKEGKNNWNIEHVKQGIALA